MREYAENKGHLPTVAPASSHAKIFEHARVNPSDTIHFPNNEGSSRDVAHSRNNPLRTRSDGGQALALAAAVFVSACLLGIVLKLLGSSAGSSHRWFISMHASYDSWGPLISAYEFYRRNNSSLYDIFFVSHIKYQYPPIAISLVAAADLLGISNRDDQIVAFNVFTWFSVLLTVPCVFGIIYGITKTGFRSEQQKLRVAFCCFVSATTLVFWPIMMSWSIGQIQTTLNLLFVCALCAWIFGNRLLSGALIGLACVFKPQFVLFLTWALIADRKMFLGQAIVVAMIAFLSLAFFGWHVHADYIRLLSFLSEHGEAFVLNQSINGFLNRLIFPELAWVDRGRVWLDGSEFPPYSPVVYLGSSVTSAAVIVAALWLAWRDGASPVTFCFMGLAVTIASPIAWDHHYGLLIGVYAVACGTFMSVPVRSSARKLAFALCLVCMLLVSVRVIPRFAGHPVLEDLLVSHLLIGAIISLMLLWLLRARRPAVELEWRL